MNDTICILPEATISKFKEGVPKNWLLRNALALFLVPFALLHLFGVFGDWYLSSGAADGKEPQ